VKSDNFYILMFTIMLLFTGCSSGKNDVISGCLKPDLTGQDFHSSFSVTFDAENEIVSDIEFPRFSDAHLNVKPYVRPLIEVNSYNPATHVIDVDVILENTSAIDVFDVRLIIYLDDSYHRLLNPDNWTDLYDIPGGEAFNPFIAYAENQPFRRFDSGSQHTENLLIYLPKGDTNVTFAIDASLSENCSEPYLIKNFNMNDLYEGEGNSSDVQVEVLDWQNDIDYVRLKCDPVLGQIPLELQNEIGSLWNGKIINSSGTTAGEYPGLIIAESSGIKLYEKVTINVSIFPEVIVEPVSLDETIIQSIDKDQKHFYRFFTSPKGIQSGTISLNCLSGSAGLTLIGSFPGEKPPGSFKITGNELNLNDLPYSRYYLVIEGLVDGTEYQLDINITQKIATLTCDVFVATDDGTEDGIWPTDEYHYPSVELNPDILNSLINWCNSFWSQYGYQLSWDGSFTIMSAEYYILDSGESEQMHDQYGRNTGTMSLYFVQSEWTAFTVPRYPETLQTVDNTYSVYGPNIFQVQSTVSHEHGHIFGYLIDQYYYDMTGCPCGDEECLPPGCDTYLFSDPDACYEGNLMWYNYWGKPWNEYDLTDSQSQWVNEFQFTFPDNFPWF
jgi:hypothetical protein